MSQLEMRPQRMRQPAPDQNRLAADLEAQKQALDELDARTDELLVTVERAAKAAVEGGDEIDAMLARIREIRAAMLDG